MRFGERKKLFKMRLIKYAHSPTKKIWQGPTKTIFFFEFLTQNFCDPEQLEKKLGNEIKYLTKLHNIRH